MLEPIVISVAAMLFTVLCLSPVCALVTTIVFRWYMERRER